MENSLKDKIMKIKEFFYSDPHKFVDEVSKLENKLIEYNLINEFVDLMVLYSYTLNYLGNSSEALKYATKGLSMIPKEGNPSLKARLLNIIGIIYYHNSHYDKAYLTLNEAKVIAYECKSFETYASILNNIGDIFRELGEYEKASEFFKLSLDISNENNLSLNMKSVVYLNLGLVDFSAGKFDDSLHFLYKSLELLKDDSDESLKGEVEYRIANVLSLKGETKKAKEIYLRVESSFIKLDSTLDLANLYLNKLKFEEIGNHEVKMDIFSNAVSFAKQSNSLKLLQEIYELIANYFEQLGDYNLALDNYKKFHYTSEELNSKLVIERLKLLDVEMKSEFSISLTNESSLEIEIKFEERRIEELKRINDDLAKKAHLDELTNIPNRRMINKYLSEISFIKKSATLYMIDIDRFKLYNDTKGHLMGDNVLVEITKAIHAIKDRRNDFFGRYGGEEFVYIALGLSYNESAKLAQEIKDSIEKLAIDFVVNGSNFLVTVSIGGAIVPRMVDTDVTTLLDIADKELYVSKNCGRNTFRIALI
jgi:diguanylate cyclase (GGDEF)-like protein